MYICELLSAFYFSGCIDYFLTYLKYCRFVGFSCVPRSVWEALHNNDIQCNLYMVSRTLSNCSKVNIEISECFLRRIFSDT